MRCSEAITLHKKKCSVLRVDWRCDKQLHLAEPTRQDVLNVLLEQQRAVWGGKAREYYSQIQGSANSCPGKLTTCNVEKTLRNGRYSSSCFQLLCNVCYFHVRNLCTLIRMWLTSVNINFSNSCYTMLIQEFLKHRSTCKMRPQSCTAQTDMEKEVTLNCSM